MSSKIFPIENDQRIAIASRSEEHDEDRNYDSFFLQHLQSIKADAAWYMNQHFIGKGGNGTTFFVTCTSGPNLGVQFALKVFHKISDSQRRKRFLDEVRHYKTLSHPSIIKVYDEGSFTVKDNGGTREYPFAIVDYVPTNLETKLGRGIPKITRLEAVRHVFNVASGVAYLHSQPKPIVHRDIKPANILVSGHDARLGDLGLAHVLMGPDKDESSEDVAAYIAMPKFYRTPELVRIARGESVKLTVASDIYQLGLVLYRAVTGFNPQLPPDNIRDDIKLNLRPIPGAAASRLDQLVDLMLKDAPEERPAATDVLTKLNFIHRELCEADHNATGMMR